MLEFERQLWTRGCRRVAGVDEAGRGPLAGPVVAAAVVFARNFIEKEKDNLFASLNDSKQLTENQRNHFFALLTQSPEVEIGIGFGDVTEIDKINILSATHLTMSRALAGLCSAPDHAIIDGLPVSNLPCPSTAVIKGDARSLSVAAASVVAKVVRDQWMMELDRWHPEYGFGCHKGYGTPTHIQALLKYGATEYHRRSFRPVREIEDIRRRLIRPPKTATFFHGRAGQPVPPSYTVRTDGQGCPSLPFENPIRKIIQVQPRLRRD